MKSKLKKLVLTFTGFSRIWSISFMQNIFWMWSRTSWNNDFTDDTDSCGCLTSFPVRPCSCGSRLSRWWTCALSWTGSAAWPSTSGTCCLRPPPWPTPSPNMKPPSRWAAFIDPSFFFSRFPSSSFSLTCREAGFRLRASFLSCRARVRGGSTPALPCLRTWRRSSREWMMMRRRRSQSGRCTTSASTCSSSTATGKPAAPLTCLQQEDERNLCCVSAESLGSTTPSSGKTSASRHQDNRVTVNIRTGS